MQTSGIQRTDSVKTSGFPSLSHVVVVDYQPGHAGLRNLLPQVVKAHQTATSKNTGGEHFVTYRQTAYGGTASANPNRAFVMFESESFKALESQVESPVLFEHVGPVTASRLLSEAKGGAKLNLKSVANHWTNRPKRSGKPSPFIYLMEVHFQGGTESVDKLRNFASDFHSANAKLKQPYQYMIHGSTSGESGVFWISFAINSLSELDEGGSLNQKVPFSNPAAVAGIFTSLSGVLLQYDAALSNPKA